MRIVPIALALSCLAAGSAWELMSATPSWIHVGSQEQALAGTALASGDFNGDDLADLASAENGSDGPQVLVFAGAAAGFGEPLQISAYAASLAGGDFNGDGFDDLVVGGSNRISLYLGGPAGLSTTEDGSWPGVPDAAFGDCLALGDINGDGRDDIAAGAPFQSGGSWYQGQGYVHVFFGRAEAPLLALPVSLTTPVPSYDSYFGDSVAIGRVTEDGFADLLVGAPGTDPFGDGEIYGAAYLYPGQAAGIQTIPMWHVEGGYGHLLGRAVATAGDVNGDNRDDMLIGAPGVRHSGMAGAGTVYLHLAEAESLSTIPDWEFHGSVRYSGVGHYLAGAGDLNGDGLAEIAVGAPEMTHPEYGYAIGQAYVFEGLRNQAPATVESWTAVGNQYSWFGQALAALRDLDGDGIGELAVSAPYDGFGDHGQVLVYSGLGSVRLEAPGQISVTTALPLEPGATLNRPDFIVSATITNRYHLFTRLEVEFKPVGTEFDGENSVLGPYLPDELPAQTWVPGLAPATEYHWRVRAETIQGHRSAWIAFNGNDSSAADLVTRENTGPSALVLAQRTPANHPIPLGQELLERKIRFEAMATDNDPEELLRLEVEVRRVGDGFSSATSSGDADAPLPVFAFESLPDGLYHWRARVLDRFGASTAWEHFGANPEAEADFKLLPFGSDGATSCMHSAAGGSAIWGFLALSALLAWLR